MNAQWASTTLGGVELQDIHKFLAGYGGTHMSNVGAQLDKLTIWEA